MEAEAFEVMPASFVIGKQKGTTRWENAQRPSGEICCRFVAREFARDVVRDDLFAPSSTHNTSSIVDYVSLKRGFPRLVLDCINANLQVEEKGLVIVDPPCGVDRAPAQAGLADGRRVEDAAQAQRQARCEHALGGARCGGLD